MKLCKECGEQLLWQSKFEAGCHGCHWEKGTSHAGHSSMNTYTSSRDKKGQGVTLVAELSMPAESAG